MFSRASCQGVIMTLILGSASPRRKEILGFYKVPFEQIRPEFDESSVPVTMPPKEFARYIAKKKAEELAAKYPDRPILTADTIVALENKIYTKPKDFEDALRILAILSGKRHVVFTAVCVAHKGKFYLGCERTLVYLNKLSAEEVRLYHQNMLHLDKAGAYTGRESGGIIVKKISGCYYNSLGLPINTARRLLAKAGINLWHYL